MTVIPHGRIHIKKMMFICRLYKIYFQGPEGDIGINFVIR